MSDLPDVREASPGLTPAILVETFPCTACQTAYPVDYQHESGFCEGCVEKGRRYMLSKLGWDEVVEIAEQTLDGTLPYEETWRVNAEAVIALAARPSVPATDTLREALVWYADDDRYRGHYPDALKDAGETARRALAAVPSSKPAEKKA